MKTCPTSTDPAARFAITSIQDLYTHPYTDVYNSIHGRQCNVRTSDSDRGLEIGRARPDFTARVVWYTDTMMCWPAGVLRHADAACIIHIHRL